MVRLTLLNHQEIAVNGDRIEWVEAVPDTTIRFASGESIVVLESLEEQPDGLLGIFMVRREDDMLNWLLGWGSHVCVLEPESLRQRLIAEAEALVQRYQKA